MLELASPLLINFLGGFALNQNRSVMNARTARVANLLPGTQHHGQENLLSSLRKLDPQTLARLVSLAQMEDIPTSN